MDEIRYYYCGVCGNIIEKVADSGNDLVCCGRSMLELEAGITDGKTEWHVPICNQNGNDLEVKIGQNPHPMDKDHYIQWIEITTNKGICRRNFKPGDTPIAHFVLCDGETVCSIYAYCNKHKLWKATC